MVRLSKYLVIYKMRKTAQWGIIVIVSFFLLFVKIRRAFACTVGSSCEPQCGCAGDCWDDSKKWKCSIPGCNEWDYESVDCHCELVDTGSFCYHNEDCLKTQCIDYGICKDWSNSGPCNGCYDFDAIF